MRVGCVRNGHADARTSRMAGTRSANVLAIVCREVEMVRRYWSSHARVASGFAMMLLIWACLRENTPERSDAGTVDTASPAASAVTPATGPGVQVTRTDAASVRLATQFKLTDENFAKFIRAADSVASLASSDSAVRAHLNQPIGDAGATEANAGLKWLETNLSVNNAIIANGLSPHDYYVMAIAIASAEQTDPTAAPPTPVAKHNAEFVRRKTAELKRLHALESNRPRIVITP